MVFCLLYLGVGRLSLKRCWARVVRCCFSSLIKDLNILLPLGLVQSLEASVKNRMESFSVWMPILRASSSLSAFFNDLSLLVGVGGKARSPHQTDNMETTHIHS